MTEEQRTEWRINYLSDEVREYSKRLEDAEKQLKESEEVTNSLRWNRDKLRAIVTMLEKAYNVHIEVYKNPQTNEAKPTVVPEESKEAK